MLRTILTVLLLTTAGLLTAADGAPGWLQEMASREVPAHAADSDALVLLNERRVTVSADGIVTTSVRKAVRILTKDGRGEAWATVVYRTDTGKVRSLQAWTLYESGNVKTYNKKDVVDAALAANDIYNESRYRSISGTGDVDPGSVFGYESVLEDRSIFTQFLFQFQDENPALTSRFVLTLPAGWTAKSITHNHEAIEPLVQGSTYTWTLNQLPPILDEPLQPPLGALVPRVNVSYVPPSGVSAGGQTFSDWNEVGAWLKTLNDTQAVATPEITAKAQSLVEGKQSEFERIAAIGAFAQDIKYVSIQTGVGRGGGYKPHMASETMSKAYGDCKDKSNLMRALLSSIGIESYPVAIYSGDRNFVHEDWASPQQFNHAIIAVKVSEETEGPAVGKFPGLGRLLFFDPTDAYTAPGFLPDHEQASFALVVSAEGGRLVRAPAAMPEQNRLERKVEYTLNEDGSIEGTIHEQAAGNSASENRRLRERLTIPVYRRVIERWVARGVPGASVSTIEAGESDGGGFFLDVSFASERYGRTMGTRLLMFQPAVVSRRSFTHLTDEERENAVVLDADTYSESVTVQLPSNFAIDEMSDPIEIETDFGSYAATWKEEDGKLIFERRMELRNATIEPENYATVKEFFETMIAAEQSPVVLVRR